VLCSRGGVARAEVAGQHHDGSAMLVVGDSMTCRAGRWPRLPRPSTRAAIGHQGHAVALDGQVPRSARVPGDGRGDHAAAAGGDPLVVVTCPIKANMLFVNQSGRPDKGEVGFRDLGAI